MTAPAAAIGETATAAATGGAKRQDDSFPPAPSGGGTTGDADAGAGDVEHRPPAVVPVTGGEAFRHSFTVGLSGGGATVFSVATLMWLHTIITYQQRHGSSFRDTCKVWIELRMLDDTTRTLTSNVLAALSTRGDGAILANEALSSLGVFPQQFP